MKTTFRTVAGAATIALLIGVAFKLACNAQSIQAPARGQTASIVATVADSEGFPLVPYDQLPKYSTFWEVQSTYPFIIAPLPCRPLNQNLAVYSMGGDEFLVDLTGETALAVQNSRFSRNLSSAALAQAQTDALLNLIDMIQTARLNAELNAALGLDDMSPLDAELDALMTYDSSTLWLEIFPVTNGIPSLLIHPPDAEIGTGIYDLFSSTNADSSTWKFEQRTIPGQVDLTDSSPDAYSKFYRLGTLKDSDGDGLTDAFENLVTHTDPYTSNAQTNRLDCVQAGQLSDPGTLSFTLTNICVGGNISSPVLTSPVTFTFGLERDWLSYTFDSSYNHYVTNSVVYTAGALYFSPAIPSSFPNPGTYTYTALVNGTASGSPCSNAVIAAIGTVTINVWDNSDADYDGICSCEEISDGTDPLDAASVLPVKLASWRFDNTNSWVGEQGQLPLSAINITGRSSWNTNAVKVSASGAVLAYRDKEAGACRANINLQTGSIRFWFRPDWGSTNAGGVGPQTEARLIEVGTKGSANGWFGLGFGAAGTNLWFGTQTNSALTLTTNLTGTISWTSNLWHQIVLTYSKDSSSLYVDGQPAVQGVGVNSYPGAAIRAQGFTIGGSADATKQAKGAFDELETFNYALDSTAVQTDYQTAVSRDSDGDGWPDIVEDFLGTNPYNAGSAPLGITIEQPVNGSQIIRQ